MKKRALLAIAGLAFLAAGLWIRPVATAQGQTGEVSFKTPEEAITFFMDAFAQGDIAKIMQACAIDEMSEKFSFDQYVNRIKALTPQSPAPSNYAFYAETNKAQFTWQILYQVRFLAYGLLTTEQDLVEGLVVANVDAEGTTRFMTEVDPARLSPLQVMQIGIPRPDLVYNERNVENWIRQAQIYGADELTERVVLIQFEEQYYLAGFTLLRYGENWKISAVFSALGGTPVSGAPLKTTEEEFQALIGSD